MARRIGLVSLLATAAGVALASSAHAAILVGQSEPSANCTTGTGQLQDPTAAPPDYTIPLDGVITSFTAASNTTGAQTKLLILQHVASTTYSVVAKSDPATFTTAGVQTFSTQIPVRTGELIGNYGKVCAITAAPGDHLRLFTGSEPATGADQVFGSDNPGFRIDLSANLERDCDHDGLGDETQDTNTSSCNPPAGPTGQRAAALKKCKKKHSAKKRKKCKKKANKLPV